MNDWTRKAVEHLPIEARIVRKIVSTLKAAGTPVTKVWDGEEYVPVRTRDAVLDAVFAVDIARLYTADGSWVLIVLGNEWDALADYTLSLEGALVPVHDWIDRNES